MRTRPAGRMVHRTATEDAGTPLIYAPTPLVGRDAEFATLRVRLLDPENRMITLTGAPGVGKSRLAMALSENVSGEFEHGARYLDLHDVDPKPTVESILADLLSVAGAPDDGERSAAEILETLIAEMRDRHMLLALDHCEHLLDALRPVLTGVVVACPRLSVLVVSDEPLRAYGESLFRLEPLPAPDDHGGWTGDLAELERTPAVELFLHRARAVRPSFRLTTDNHESVARLCARTDGLPLAIELAATRMKLSAPQSVLTDLERDLCTLSGSESETLSRHRDVCTAIEWSLARLDRDEQELLSSLASLHNRFDLDAAKGVGRVTATQAQRCLERLVDSNLLFTGECSEGSVTFHMPRLIRQHMLRRLRRSGEYELVMRRHAEYLLGLARNSEAALTGPEQAMTLEMLRYWHDDFDAALRFLSAAAEHAKVVELASALHQHWQVHGRIREGVDWLEDGLAEARLPGPVAIRAGRVLGELLISLGRYDAAEKRLVASLDDAEEAGDRAEMGRCRRLLGLAAHCQGDLPAAVRLLEEGLAILRKAELDHDHAAATRHLAMCKVAEGDYAAAKRSADIACQAYTLRRDVRNSALARRVLADVAAGMRHLDKAIVLYRTSLRELGGLDDVPSCATALERFTVVLTDHCGRRTESWRRAARLLGAVEAMRAAIGCPPLPAVRSDVESVLAQARVRLGEEAFDEAREAGLAMDLPAAIADALLPMRDAQVAWTRRYGEDNPLTGREVEVAELVAAGLTNREIARRLGIAEWTVVNHVRKIMRKLDCSSRVQVASWVMRTRNGTEEDRFDEPA